MIVAFRLTLSPTDEDRASALLWTQGTTGIEVRETRGGRVELLAYFEDRPGLEATLRLEAQSLPGTRLSRAAVPEVDWVARFREGFRSSRVGAFVVAPPWDLPEGDRDRVLVIDPGRAFGTGTHESTRLCLSAIADLAAAGPLGRVLDVGTGTGILAMAAVRLGASLAAGVDRDADAIAEAGRHAELNGVEVRLIQGDGARAWRPGTFDLVIANVAAPFLLERRDELAAVTAGGGTLVLAGFLDVDLPALRPRYDALGAVEERRDGEWAAFILRRPQ
ncbi:MAG TPA: 50S ribosomal protein L11 methyltransferase [Vicinamibacteria bacterium]